MVSPARRSRRGNGTPIDSVREILAWLGRTVTEVLKYVALVAAGTTTVAGIGYFHELNKRVAMEDQLREALAALTVARDSVTVTETQLRFRNIHDLMMVELNRAEASQASAFQNRWGGGVGDSVTARAQLESADSILGESTLAACDADRGAVTAGFTTDQGTVFELLCDNRRFLRSNGELGSNMMGSAVASVIGPWNANIDVYNAIRVSINERMDSIRSDDRR